MAVRDSGWIQLFAETNQEAADLHVQAFRLAEELSLPVMVCMDGFILTHAVEAHRRPRAGRRRRLPPPLRASSGARSRRPGLHRGHGRPRGLRGGPLPRPPPPARRARPHPRRRRRVRRATSAARAAACSTPTAPRTPRPWSWRSDRCSGRSRTRSTPGEMPGSASGSSGSRPSVPSRVDAVARRPVERATCRRRREGVQRRIRRSPLDRRRHGHPSRRTARSTRSSPVSAAGRSPGGPRGACSPTRQPDRLETAHLPRPRHRARRAGAARMAATTRRSGPIGRERAPRPRRRPAESR